MNRELILGQHSMEGATGLEPAAFCVRGGGAAGVWKDLTDNVNFMASNLTNHVCNIADVTTVVAKGDH